MTRPTTGLISVDDALAAILAHRQAPATETAPLYAALGRTLAAPLVAQVTQPPLAVSAMDGYAVRHSDVATAGATLRVIGEAPAGKPFPGAIASGEAVRIFTGGAIPDGADHVVIQENVTAHATQGDPGAQINIAAPEAGPRHIRPAGLDFSRGDTLALTGTTLSPAHLAAAAAANHSHLPVLRRPRVALLANGDELREPGSALAPGEIIASSRYSLAGLIRDWGGEPVDLGIAADSVTAIQRAVTGADSADIIVPVGGASVGDHDHMRHAFDGLGAETIFAKVAVKPGKPTWFARLGARQRVLGLPGNPASALVCAHLFLKPLITGDSARRVRARLTHALTPHVGREAFLRAQLNVSSTGALEITPATNQDSALIHPFLTANALIRRGAQDPARTPGDPVDAWMIGPL
ncbi:MAG: gephyrin-like molybdotransferase Glp [Pseudomonadota bacterium]